MLIEYEFTKFESNQSLSLDKSREKYQSKQCLLENIGFLTIALARVSSIISFIDHYFSTLVRQTSD